MKFLIQRDFSKSSIPLNSKEKKIFGSRNQGCFASGDTAEKAIEIWNNGLPSDVKQKPFYLKATPL